MRKFWKNSKNNQEKIFSVYRQTLIIFIFLLIIIILVLSSLDIESQSLRNIIIGVISSLISSTIFYLSFAAIVEDEQKEYSAESAAKIATEYALKRFELAPKYVYPSSTTSDEKFDQQFKKNFLDSNFYYFKGASAGFAMYRLSNSNTVRNSRALKTKSIQFLLLDPRDDDLLEEFAKSNLKLTTDGENIISLDLIREESEKIRKDIYMTILGIYNSRFLCNINVTFHDEFMFFRSEIFANGLFISYYDGDKTFPGSIYYDNSSDIYQAYLKNFQYYQEKGEQKFSLREFFKDKDKNQDQNTVIKDVLQSIGCKDTLEVLQEYTEEKFKVYRTKINQ